jgi:hypothetical protein
MLRSGVEPSRWRRGGWLLLLAKRLRQQGVLQVPPRVLDWRDALLNLDRD